jgi:hypothetical protein
MKPIVFSFLVACLFLSCKKQTLSSTYKVSYSVSSDFVSEFKITQDGTEIFVETPFSGAKDTTISIQAYPGTVLKLNAIADNASIGGSISVDGALKAATATSDIDGDGAARIQVEYTLPKQ